MDNPARLEAPRRDWPLMRPIPMTLDMLMSAIEVLLVKSGQAWVVGLLIFGHDNEFTILSTLGFFLLRKSAKVNQRQGLFLSEIDFFLLG